MSALCPFSGLASFLWHNHLDYAAGILFLFPAEKHIIVGGGGAPLVCLCAFTADSLRVTVPTGPRTFSLGPTVARPLPLHLRGTHLAKGTNK